MNSTWNTGVNAQARSAKGSAPFGCAGHRFGWGVGAGVGVGAGTGVGVSVWPGARLGGTGVAVAGGDGVGVGLGQGAVVGAGVSSGAPLGARLAAGAAVIGAPLGAVGDRGAPLGRAVGDRGAALGAAVIGAPLGAAGDWAAPGSASTISAHSARRSAGQLRRRARMVIGRPDSGIGSPHRVVAAGMPWAAARDTAHAHPAAAQQPVPLDGLLCVARAAGLEATGRGQPCEHDPIETDHADAQPFHVVPIVLSSMPVRSSRVMVSRSSS